MSANDSKTLGPLDHTIRGFEHIEFRDSYGAECCLQQSSLAVYEKPGTSAVWLGIHTVEPKVMASEAASVGVKTSETTGWVPYPVPEKVLINGRMHLTREQVEALILHLQSWIERDTFAGEEAHPTGDVIPGES